MILDIDAGNTFLKWRYAVAADGEVGTIHLLRRNRETGFPEEWRSGVARVRLGSVSRDVERLALEIAQWTGVEPECARTLRAHGGVKNSYSDPARMGVDRWLAMLAARSRVSGPCCIVDAGTAITLDGLDAEGMHLGGYIVPGLWMMEHALLEGTGQVRVESESDSTRSTEPGSSTDAAVRNGTLAMAIAFVERGIDHFRRACGSAPRVIIAGGDAALMQANLRVESVVVPGLVLDGLAIAIP